MIVLVLALGGGFIAGLLAGGSFANLERLSLRLWWAAVGALALQLIAFSPLGAPLPAAAGVGMHLASYALLLAFVVANIRRPPVLCFGAGVAANTLCIAVNRGYMPAREAALRLAGLPVSATPHNNSVLAGAGAHLAFLGDVFAVPHWLPLANIFSVGDLLIGVGLAWLIAETMRRGGAAAVRATLAEGPASSGGTLSTD